MAGMATRSAAARTPAWGADLPTSDDQARERLLDAAESATQNAVWAEPR